MADSTEEKDGFPSESTRSERTSPHTSGLFFRGKRLVLWLARCCIGPLTASNLAGWGFLILLVLFIKGCVIDQYTIPSGSMEPTLKGDPRFLRGDRVLVNKWRFGPRIPFTTYRLWPWGAPNRWDIVVFRSPDPDAKHPVLIKRVVALPGEQVHIQDGRIYIDGVALDPPEAMREILYYTTELSVPLVERKRQFLALAQVNKPISILNPRHLPVIRLYAEMERLHPRVVHLDVDGLSDDEVAKLCLDVHPDAIGTIGSLFDFAAPSMQYGILDTPEYAVVPPDHYFLLGDNSRESLDGRVYGWVPHHHLYGTAVAVWWPWQHRRDFSGFSKTWWGMMLLYGVPIVVIGFELFTAYREFRRPGGSKSAVNGRARGGRA